MTQLSEVVRALAARDGVDLVLLLSADGLPIDQAGARSADGEAAAALTATLLRHAERLGSELGGGAPASLVLELDDGAAVVAPLGREGALLVAARGDADLGGLLFELRRHRPAVAALL
jgi:predicted regulator of Ras-like GTPase activity (Roadblock/LC7/MglB family)